MAKFLIVEDDPALMRWANIVRVVERIGDYATNIAEDIIYVVEGEIVRHQPYEQA